MDTLTDDFCIPITQNGELPCGLPTYGEVRIERGGLNPKRPTLDAYITSHGNCHNIAGYDPEKKRVIHAFEGEDQIALDKFSGQQVACWNTRRFYLIAELRKTKSKRGVHIYRDPFTYKIIELEVHQSFLDGYFR